VPRLWERHVLNCAVVVDPQTGIVASNALVGDVGSGAGLPGLVWAVARPDLRVVLIEPLLRRSTFLEEAVEGLGLRERVTVWRGRGEDAPHAISPLDVVTARAVAPLDRLLGWTTPLLRPGGVLALLKGSSAVDEVEQAASVAQSLNVRGLRVTQAGVGIVDPPTTVVVGERGAAE
jgi:16S rRNA (guanine527-N7)-methyltransferase